MKDQKANQLANYVQVNERIQKFYEQYPDGRLTDDVYRGGKPGDLPPLGGRQPWEILEIDGHTFIVYYAVAYRTPEDALPGRGVAWEPFPGPTPFTRDSELMNAQTSSWGRALAAVGIEVQKSIATAEDVKAREQKSTPKTSGNGRISDERVEQLYALFQESPVDAGELKLALVSYGVENASSVKAGLAELTPEAADDLQKSLRQRTP